MTYEKLETPIKLPVKNAGLVLLNSYISMLFERLSLVENGKFMGDVAQQKAVYILQYGATGLLDIEPLLLLLNKILCGIPIEFPLNRYQEIEPSEKEMMEGLLRAMINYWPAIGACSIDGFRGNWLVRDGLLTEHDDRWELAVEKRAYDVLIHKSPFSFSIIKHPWMPKPLHVVWGY